MNFKLLQTWETNYCADTVEWCPINPYQHFFVCGTYELQNPENPASETGNSTQIRIGQLHLFSVTAEAKLCLHSTTDVSGILDCKWYPRVIHDKVLLVTANADGRIIVWSFENVMLHWNLTINHPYPISTPRMLSCQNCPLRSVKLHPVSVVRLEATNDEIIIEFLETSEGKSISGQKTAKMFEKNKNNLPNQQGRDMHPCDFSSTYYREESQPFLSNISQFNVNNEKILSLSVDWSVNNCDVSICVSDSAGYVSILHVDTNFGLTLQHKLKVHDYETWIATFDYKNSSLIFTGGDDCLLKLTDLRDNKKIAQLQEHTSGVTSIRFNHFKDFIFASGSYDETVKLWDTRKMSESLSTSEVGGGVWRIKWDPHKAKDILVAGMYSGFFWMNYNHENETVIHKDSFKEHASIAYGADICYLSSTEIERRCPSHADRDQILNSNIKLTATCSFYDKKLCLCLLK